ncbi:CHAT domain-containing protein [Nocardioides sp.]|uniref:CHAT domain-containing protein n=1 Tax=Nocardioides sp. TaxID=35761 RepID=UPI002B269A6C|nr:CHAT domain-containing protein [Nocardioides sp.]
MTVSEVELTDEFVDALVRDESVEQGLRQLRATVQVDRAALERLVSRAEDLLHVAPASAERLCELVMASDDVPGRSAAAARAQYAWARVCAERGELERALQLIAAARAALLEVNDELGALRTDLGRMQVLDDLGRHGAAVEVGEGVLAALEALPVPVERRVERDTVRAAALCNVGVAHSFTGFHERSLECYSASESAYTALGLSVQVAQQRANRGIELLALGRAREAVECLASARAAFEADGDRLWAAKCAVNLAEAFHQLGSLVEALTVLEESRTTLAELGAHAEEVRAGLETGRAYLAAGLYAEARSACVEAALRADEHDLRHDAGYASFTLALAMIGLDDLDGAATELRRAERLFTETDDRQYLARVQLTQAELAVLREDVELASTILHEAMTALEAGRWQIPLASARLLESDLAPSMSRRSALLVALGPLVHDLGIPELRHAYDLRLARVSIEQGRVDEAETALRRAVELVESRGASLGDPQLRIAFRSDRVAAHDALIDLLARRGTSEDVEEACRLSDLAKAQTLLDLTGGTVGSEAGAIDRAAVATAAPAGGELQQLRSDLNATYTALQTAEEASRRALLRERAGCLEDELAALRLRASVATTSGGAVSLASRSTMGDQQRWSWILQESRTGRPVVHFHVLSNDVLVFVIVDGQVHLRRLVDVMPDITRCLDALVAQWSRFAIGAVFVRRHAHALTETTVAVLTALHALVLKPVQHLLEATRVDELVVVPHRQLQRVPFHALHDGEIHLAEQWAVTLSPTLPRRATQPPRPLVGMLALAVPDDLGPQISDEAQFLSNRQDSFVLRGAEASSEALAAHVPGPERVHLACHGLYRPDNPLFSALKLGDGWLTSADVLDLDLGGALVVLSACESGRMSVRTAEPVGLAWAFLAAGASGVIVSQWLVDDAVTVAVMRALHAHLDAGTPTAEALRLAQLDVAIDHSHPYYWAPFVYVAGAAAYELSEADSAPQTTDGIL